MSKRKKRHTKRKIEVAKEVDQNRYNLREKELKIAWQPEKARSGANRAFSGWLSCLMTAV